MPNSNSALAPGLRLQPSSPSSQPTTPSPSSTTSQPSNQERYWTHHTHTTLESALASTHKDTITLSADVDDVGSNSSSTPRSTPLTLSSTAGFSDESDYSLVKAEPLAPKMKTNLRLKLGGITPPILKQQSSRPSQRILEMFAELVESRMESCERVTNMVKRYHRGRDLQMQRVV